MPGLNEGKSFGSRSGSCHWVDYLRVFDSVYDVGDNRWPRATCVCADSPDCIQSFALCPESETKWLLAEGRSRCVCECRRPVSALARDKSGRDLSFLSCPAGNCRLYGASVRASGQSGMPSRAFTDPITIGDGNAQVEDKVELQKAVQSDRDGTCFVRPSRQAPRHDQTLKQIPAQCARHYDTVGT